MKPWIVPQLAGLPLKKYFLIWPDVLRGSPRLLGTNWPNFHLINLKKHQVETFERSEFFCEWGISRNTTHKSSKRQLYRWRDLRLCSCWSCPSLRACHWRRMPWPCLVRYAAGRGSWEQTGRSFRSRLSGIRLSEEHLQARGVNWFSSIQLSLEPFYETDTEAQWGQDK